MIDKIKASELRGQGLSYKDIALSLGCSVDWCKRNLRGTQKGHSLGLKDTTPKTLPILSAEELGRLDYNTVEWDKHFYLDSESPTGLRWLLQERPYRHKGDVAGYPQRTSHGARWLVQFKGKLWVVARIVCIMLHGKFDPLLVVDHLDGNPSNNSFSNLTIKTSRGNAQNTVLPARALPRGVLYRENKGSPSYVSCWIEVSGLKRTKSFSCKKLGDCEALEAAIRFRTTMLERLNEQGMQYTSRHS